MNHKTIKVFFSYADEDTSLQSKLANHLTSLKRQEVITVFHYKNITAGEEWGKVINTHLESANIILLLISSDFIASDYCYDVELKKALERHESGEAQVIPIILRPSDWKQSLFGKLTPLPSEGKPVTTWQDEDEAFLDIVNGIRKVTNKINGEQDSIEDLQVNQEQKTILMLSANPKNTELSRSRVGAKEIKSALKRSTCNDLFELKNELQIDASDLTQELSAVEPFIMHVTGCENSIENLVLGIFPEGDASLKRETLITDLFQHYGKIKCVILNGCYSEKQAKEIAQYIDYVIGIGQDITDDDSIYFLDEFYFQIGSMKTIRYSYNLAYSRQKRNKSFDDKQFIILNKIEVLRNKELEEELISYNLSLENSPDDVVLWTGKADILRDLGLSDEADKAYEKASNLQPKNHEILSKQGEAQEQFGNHAKAVSTYEKALVIEPNSYKIWWKKGKAHFAVKNYSEAIESYVTALDLCPPLPDNYVICREYGDILRISGKHKESIKLYRKGLSFEPRYRVSSYAKKMAYKKEYYENK